MDVNDHRSILSAKESIENWIEEESNGSRSLVAVVNNAGIADTVPMELESLAQMEQIIQTNIMGVIRVSSVFVPLLRRARGRLVVVGSANGSVSIPLMSTYSASKFAMEGWCDAVRLELEPSGIRVSLIQAGGVKTPIVQKIEAQAKISESEFSPDQQDLAKKYYSSFFRIFDKVIHDHGRRSVEP
jgi:short-subunit dehydrogenase